jgi:hypothetical protein
VIRFLAPFIGFLLFFAGCTGTTGPKAPVINTYNTSSNTALKPNQKSTMTYPGSGKPIVSPNAQVPTPPIQSDPVIIESAPITTVEIPPLASTTEVALPSQEAIEKTYDAPPVGLSHNGEMIKIAVLIPQKTIKKYAITSVNTVISYLLYQNYSFDLNVFNSGDEKEESILKALGDIKAGGYTYIIAPVTPEGANVIAAHVKETIVFIPTLHHSSLNIVNENIFFGGIDYEGQVALLSGHAGERVGIFEDGSGLSFQLSAFVKKYHERVFYEKRVESSKANFKQMFKGNTSLNSASYYLNTPLVTSSLIASQLRANDIYPHALLSTQINYNPLLLTLTQYEDRNDMFIANSIQRTPANLEEINTLFGHDIVYDWVNYATSIGAEFVTTHFYANPNEKIFTEGFKNRQIVYNTSVYKPERHAFKKIQP